MRWTFSTYRGGRGEYRDLLGKSEGKERYLLQDPDIDRRIIVKWISMKWNFGAWTGLM